MLLEPMPLAVDAGHTRNPESRNPTKVG